MIDEGLDQPEAQNGCPIANSYSDESAKHLIEMAGFKVTRIQQRHIFTFKIPEYKEHIYVKQPWFATMPQEVFATLERRLGWHLLIDAVSS